MRYGIYFIPGPGPLRDLAASWLGYDIVRGMTVRRSETMMELLPNLDALTDAPRRYGLHATLKAPFRLAQGSTPIQLLQALAHLCYRLQPMTLSGLAVMEMDNFFCLVPVGDMSELNCMAATLVRDLDRFRAPLDDRELQRRMAGNLSMQEQAHLRQWGYPYVMENFRFHISLTGPVADAVEKEEIRKLLQVYLSPACQQPLQIDALCLVREPEAGAAFELVQRFEFRA
ncbi:MAG: DUF1045 domain-containing protein [Desulfocapsaceae bacterium]|nr:DUF1045 domain-containing protein [Desulfocapsaceae bacterium]